MNPYAVHLGGRDPLAVIAATSKQLSSLVDAAGTEGVESAPAPGKWSIRQILCHLADCELVFAVRLRQTLAEPHHVVQPFDQELWAKRYDSFTAHAALAVFTAVREWNLALVSAASPIDFTKPVTHPECGEMTFRTLIETMAGHDRNHVKQVETIAAGR
jgi:hypothetical protein